MKLKSKFIVAITAIMLSAFIFFACQKVASNEDKSIELSAVLKEFTVSNEFKRSVNSFQELGEIDKKESNYEIVNVNGKEFAVFKIYFTKNNKLTGFIEAIKMSSKVKNVIPNDDRYLMTLVKYENYDFQTMTGKVQLFDLNYDNYKYASLAIEKGYFKEKIVSKLSTEISTKYQSLVRKNNLVINGSSIPGRNHFCDENQNGNVGYFECVGCFINACGTSNVCTGMCFLTAPYCGGSIGAACVYLSIAY